MKTVICVAVVQLALGLGMKAQDRLKIFSPAFVPPGLAGKLLVEVEDRAEWNDSVTGRRITHWIHPENRIRNCCSKIDGHDLCVSVCVNVAARQQGVGELSTFTLYCQTKSGGFWPERLHRRIAAHAPAFGDWTQKYDGAIAVRDLLEEARLTGKVACVSDDGPGRYGRQVAAFVCVLHLDPPMFPGPARACLWDPNWPNTVEWLDRDELLNNRIGKTPWAVMLTGGSSE